MSKKLITLVVIVALIIISALVCYIHSQKNDASPVISDGLITIKAGWCGDLFKKDEKTLVYINGRYPDYKIASSTIVDVGNIKNVQTVADDGLVVSMADFMKQQLPLSWSTIKSQTCAPGWAHITGNFNSSGVFVATEIVEHVQ